MVFQDKRLRSTVANSPVVVESMVPSDFMLLSHLNDSFLFCWTFLSPWCRGVGGSITSGKTTHLMDTNSNADARRGIQLRTLYRCTYSGSSLNRVMQHVRPIVLATRTQLWSESKDNVRIVRATSHQRLWFLSRWSIPGSSQHDLASRRSPKCVLAGCSRAAFCQ